MLVVPHLVQPAHLARRHRVLDHLLAVGVQRQVVGGVGVGETLIEDEGELLVLRQLLGRLRVVRHQNVVEGDFLVLLQEHHQGLVQLVLVLAHGGAPDVREQLAEQFDEVGVRNPNAEEDVRNRLQVLRLECEEAVQQAAVFGGLEQVGIQIVAGQQPGLR